MLNPETLMLLTALALAGCAATPQPKSVESSPVSMPAPVMADSETAIPQPAESAPASKETVMPAAAHAPRSTETNVHKVLPAYKAMPSLMMAKPVIPARAFCLKDTDCGSEYAAYGYIIFTSRPTSEAARERYLAVCRAYLGTLEPVSNHTAPKSQIATTFWFLTSQPKDEHSCEELIALYDYARATEITTALRELGVAGPLLVAWGNPYADQSEQDQRLLIDLSRLPPNELENAFLIWRDNISQDQRFWGERFNIELVRIEFRNFIQKYGESILKIVSAS